MINPSYKPSSATHVSFDRPGTDGPASGRRRRRNGFTGFSGLRHILRETGEFLQSGATFAVDHSVNYG